MGTTRRTIRSTREARAAPMTTSATTGNRVRSSGVTAPVFFVVVLVASLALAQNRPTVLQGSWTASAGPRVLSGTFSADIGSATPDSVRGSWTLLEADNRIVLEGTWSMTRSGRGWQGSWSARVLTRERATPGRVFSGSWQAAMEGSTASTLPEMFQRTVEHQVAGSWRSGPQQGHWWLKGPP